MDWTTLAVAVIAHVAPTVAAVLAWRSSRNTMASVTKTETVVTQLEVRVNSRMDELLKAEHARGVAEGREAKETVA
jgi:C4-dicarboxylate-specific signal transduction histidine kinase